MSGLVPVFYCGLAVCKFNWKMNLIVFLTLSASTLPSSWHGRTVAVALPQYLSPMYTSKCMVDVTAHYFYSPTYRVDLVSGEIKPLWIYDRASDSPDYNAIEFKTSWRELTKPWDPSTIDSFFYAKGDVVGIKTPARMSPKSGPVIYYLGPFGGPKVFRNSNLTSFFKDGLTWFCPTSVIYSDSLSFRSVPDGPAFLYGRKPEIYRLPEYMDYATPIQTGIVWNRKIGYVYFRPSSSPEPLLCAVDFSSKKPKVTPIPSSAHDLPTAGVS